MPETNLHQFTQVLKNKANQMGFHLVGVASPEPPSHLDIYLRWLSQGFNAEMAWMATERSIGARSDPLKLLSDCKAILVLGIHYPRPSSLQEANRRFGGRVASYALGNDYHEVLIKRLQNINAFIQDQIGENILGRWFTDTGPVLEREMAQRAGLGWIGKNTCLINPKLGSYFLLAEIFLGIELEIDPPFSIDHCGSCTRCIEMCPTRCITPERTLNANRCISYLTIEHKGFIPKDLRSLMGNWIFGCDICQQVCPWNIKFADKEHDVDFSARPGVPPLDLLEEMKLTTQAFYQKFSNSPIKRSKRRGYLRNIAIALGNAGNETAVPALAIAIKDDEPLIRGHAAWALGQIGGSMAKEVLHQTIRTEKNEQVIDEIQTALNNL